MLVLGIGIGHEARFDPAIARPALSGALIFESRFANVVSPFRMRNGLSFAGTAALWRVLGRDALVVADVHE